MTNDDRTRIMKPEEHGANASENQGTMNSDKTRVLNRPDPNSALAREEQEEQLPRTRVMSSQSQSADTSDAHELTVAWLVIVEGPGRGCSREVYSGMNSVGRGSDERIPLNYGDATISREAHAYVIYDEKQGDFYVQHGGKSNLVRLNDAPVLSPMPLAHGDVIEMGDTKLMFIPLCSESFSWNSDS